MVIKIRQDHGGGSHGGIGGLRGGRPRFLSLFLSLPLAPFSLSLSACSEERPDEDVVRSRHLQAGKRTQSAGTLTLAFQPSQLREINLCILRPQSLAFPYGSLSRWRRRVNPNWNSCSGPKSRLQTSNKPQQWAQSTHRTLGRRPTLCLL